MRVTTEGLAKFRSDQCQTVLKTEDFPCHGIVGH